MLRYKKRIKRLPYRCFIPSFISNPRFQGVSRQVPVLILKTSFQSRFSKGQPELVTYVTDNLIALSSFVLTTTISSRLFIPSRFTRLTSHFQLGGLVHAFWIWLSRISRRERNLVQVRTPTQSAEANAALTVHPVFSHLL